MEQRTPTIEEFEELKEIWEIAQIVAEAGMGPLDGGARPGWQPDRPIYDWFARRLHGIAGLLHLRSRGA